jgi:gas vesicle protein
MDRFFRFVGGVVVGAALGAGLVLLMAPRSGEESRRLIQERAQAVLDEGRHAAETRRQELTVQLSAMKKPSRPSAGS